MSKQQYRSRLGIISDILSATIECGRTGIIISSLARSTNLSYNTAVENCQKLIEAGLMKTTSDGKNIRFVATEKGIEVFHEMHKFLETIQTLNIRY